ncbi:hypothetical protein ACZ90_40465 [Streptomyces albus subsp. albus]|nr:hypothetical protein ACZ90_40465 [Streptomyces albus subsp. albus]
MNRASARHHRPTWARTAPGWVAAAADDPAGLRALWRVDPSRPVRLATGRTFDAVTVDLRTGMEAVDLLRHGGPRPLGAGHRPAGGGRPPHCRIPGGLQPSHRTPLPVRAAGTGLVGAGLFPALVDHERERMRLLVPPGSGRWFGRPAEGAAAPGERMYQGAVDYHGAGEDVALPGPAAGAGDRLGWAIRPGTPVDRLHTLLLPLVTALTAAHATVAWCAGAAGAPGATGPAGRAGHPGTPAPWIPRAG